MLHGIYLTLERDSNLHRLEEPLAAAAGREEDDGGDDGEEIGLEAPGLRKGLLARAWLAT